MEMIEIIKKNELIPAESIKWFFNDYQIEVDDETWEEIEYCFDHIDDDGKLHEFIDGQIDIYTSDLWKWAAESYHFIDDAISEGLVDTSNFNMISAMQAGQYVQIRQNVYEDLEDLKDKLEEIYNV